MLYRYYSSSWAMQALLMDTSSMGLSCASVLTSPIRCTIFIPEVTRPKMVCFPSSQGVGARVMKLFGQEMSVWRAGGGREGGKEK